MEPHRDLRPFIRSERNIWTDGHIACKMLSAHLDGDHDGASRNARAIAKTVSWIDSVSGGGRRMVDLGCGPGLYAREFYRLGYEVTGIDVNGASIAYAREHAESTGVRAEYRRADYVADGIEGTYDIAICVYCDFGALVPSEQAAFLGNARAALDDGGVLVLDVFGSGLSATKGRGRTWRRNDGEGFWSAAPHFILEETAHFPEERAWGTRTIVIEDNAEPKEYITWDQYYDEASITGLLASGGFKAETVERGLIEGSDFTSSDVMFIMARKA